MVEELYIYDKDGVRQSVDLNSPSGVTLKWVSNLFNSLDKVNCSYSYTFKIPMTRHNREVFDFAEDVRHVSGMLGKKIKAEFIQNGIPLFNNGNLYIEKSTGDSYSCVFTWDVIEGLQKLKDDGCNLNELRKALINAGEYDDELTDEGWVKDDFDSESYYSTTGFNNAIKTLKPYYQAGVPFPFYDNTVDTYYGAFSGCYPRPVMPTKYLLNAIEKAFGVKFNLGQYKAGESDLKVLDSKDKVFDGDNIISYGCVPLVSSDMTDKQLSLFTMSLVPKKIASNYTFFHQNHILGQDNVLVFENGKSKFDAPQNERPYIFNVYAEANENTDTDINAAVTYVATTGLSQVGFATAFEAEIELKFRVKSSMWRYDKWADSDDNKMQLKIFSRKTTDEHPNEYESEDVTSIKPAYIQTYYTSSGDWDYDILTFDSVKSEGFEAISVGEEQGAIGLRKQYFFYMSLPGAEYVDFEVMRITPKINDAKVITHYMDTFTNLPDINCLTFVKSLFYMMGKYPQANSNGVIRGMSYTTLRDNIAKGYVLDWSSYVISRDENTEGVSFTLSDFKQNNYYMTQWDDLDRTEEDLEDEEDIYEDGYVDIVVDNKNLDEKQTVFQISFYPPYILSRKHPYIPTGNTVKAWNLDMSGFDEPTSIISEKETKKYVLYKPWEVLSMCESKPAYGILHCRSMGNNSQKRYLRMDVLNPYRDAPTNSGLSYLQKIIEHPFVVTEKLILNECILMNIDFSRPVYLEKYNSYFAIISIQRDSKGVCKCELIKLPA